jgi:hypothetical protein
MSINFLGPSARGTLAERPAAFDSDYESRAAECPTAAALLEPLGALAERLQPHALAAAMRHIFAELNRLLEYLRLIELGLRKDEALRITLPVFARVHRRAHALVKYLATCVARTEGVCDLLRDTLDGAVYALDHELRRAFNVELKGLSGSQPRALTRARLEHAHGLLRNCFQQTTIALAQVFNPALDGACLFDDLRVRREQSMMLCRELEGLIDKVRIAEHERRTEAVAALVDSLEEFRDGEMCHLMYRDWGEYEDFVGRVKAACRTAQVGPVLHTLACYLETLLGQVRMRSALAAPGLDVAHPETL